MSQQTISLGADETIELERIGGDVHVEGWDRPDLQVRGDLISVDRRAGSVVLSCVGDLVLSIPHSSRIALGNVGGDVELENLAGAIDLHLVGGDATLRNLTGTVRLRDMIGGELHVEKVADLLMNSSKAGDRFNSAELARRRVEEATHRAVLKIGRAEQRTKLAKGRVEEATQRAEQEIRRAEQRTHHISSQVWGPPEGTVVRPQKMSEPGTAPSEEERMAILRMLQDHKITSEQAEKLLAALEGNA